MDGPIYSIPIYKWDALCDYLDPRKGSVRICHLEMGVL